MLVSLFAIGLYCVPWRLALLIVALGSCFSLAYALLATAVLGWTLFIVRSVRYG